MSRHSLWGSWTRVAFALVIVTIANAAWAPRAGAAPLTEFDLPVNATARNLIDGPDGALWFAEKTATGTNAIGRITTAGTITGTPVSSAGDVGELAFGVGGTLWFTIDDGGKAIGERSSSGQITLITPGMDGLNMGAAPVELEAGLNGTVWFLDHGTIPAIGEITATGQILEYPTSTGGDPDDLAIAADGDAGFTVFDAPGGVGTATAGAVTGTSATVLPTGAGTMPAGITAGDDGNLWFSDPGKASIGRVTPSGTVAEFGSANGMQTNADPDALTAGPDGNVWFDDQYANSPEVGKVTPTGQITEYPIANQAWDVTVGIDGNVWFATGNNDFTDPGVARVVSATSQINIFGVGLGSGAVIGDGTNMVSGPDGNLWLIDIGTPNAIVRADVQLPPTVTTVAAQNVTTSSAQIDGSANGRGAASTVTIQYGTTPALGSTAAAGSEPPDDTAGAVSATVSGLPAGTTIYYRLVASNTYGTVFGSMLQFKTTTATTAPPSTPRTLHATTGNQQITVTLPASAPCLAAGARLPLKFSSTAISGSKAAKLSFKHAAAFIDRGVKHTRIKLVTVRHRKHRKRVTVYVPNAIASHTPATLAPALHGRRAGTHVLRLTLTYTRTRHVGHRTVRSTVTKTIKTQFTVC
jgi:streptogramin lyase